MQAAIISREIEKLKLIRKFDILHIQNVAEDIGMKNKLSAVICCLNSQYIHSSLAPWCLLAGARRYCDEGVYAEVIEGTINEKTSDVLKRISELRPQVVAFSCYIWNIGAVMQLVQLLKNELPEAVIILGGPEVSYNAAEILNKEPLVQYIISGEGERPFALLLNAIHGGYAADGIPGISLRTDGRVVEALPYVSDEDPPSPYSEKYFAALKGRIAYLETSRGCPFSCAFCLSGYGKVRYFDIERAKSEMLLLANSGSKTIKLVDRTFNANRQRAAELFRFIIDNYNSIPRGVCFHFEIGGDLLDEDTMKLLEAAPTGLIQFEIGIQSLSAETLAAVNRRTDLERLKGNIMRLAQKRNIHVHIDLIAGLPYEGLKSFAEGFNTAYYLGADMLQLGFLKLLYGSPMYRQSRESLGSFCDKAPYEVLETPWISREELAFLHRAEDALERLYNSGRFRRTLSYLLESSGLTPFELFGGFGEHLNKSVIGISLNDYIAEAFEYFGAKPGVEKAALRDAMVCDYLATNSSGKLPQALRVEDKELGRIKRMERTGGRRGVAILYSEHCAVYADFEDKNPVTGEFALTKIELGKH